MILKMDRYIYILNGSRGSDERGVEKGGGEGGNKSHTLLIAI